MKPWQLRVVWALLLVIAVLSALSWHLAKAQIAINPLQPMAKQVQHGRPGPWGELEYVSINIEIPDEFLDLTNAEAPNWLFKGVPPAGVAGICKGAGMTDSEWHEFQAKATWQETPEGTILFPNEELVWNLTPAIRAGIYERLAEWEENIDQFYAFTYVPERLSRRLDDSGLSPETIEMFKHLLYPQGKNLRFADTDLVLRHLKDPTEKLRFEKTITRRCSLLVKLRVRGPQDVNSLLDYWGHGGRAKDLRPFLESLSRVDGGCSVDISHLLPRFVRERIYTFPEAVETGGLGQGDCHWTALNFFENKTLPHFPNPAAVADYLIAHYAPVGEGTAQARLGDILCVETKDGLLIHSAVYIADDIVFTKNGGGDNQPWILMKLDDMMPYYEMPGDTPRLICYRKKGL